MSFCQAMDCNEIAVTKLVGMETESQRLGMPLRYDPKDIRDAFREPVFADLTAPQGYDVCEGHRDALIRSERVMFPKLQSAVYPHSSHERKP